MTSLHDRAFAFADRNVECTCGRLYGGPGGHYRKCRVMEAANTLEELCEQEEKPMLALAECGKFVRAVAQGFVTERYEHRVALSDAWVAAARAIVKRLDRAGEAKHG